MNYAIPTNVTQVLCGHTSPETAFVVQDYPYGFRLRCKIRYWLESRPKHGFRFVSQTTNPKLPAERWNTPRAGIYHVAAVLYLDEEQHVQCAYLSPYSSRADRDQFRRIFATAIAATPQLAANLDRLDERDRLEADRLERARQAQLVDPADQAVLTQELKATGEEINSAPSAIGANPLRGPVIPAAN
jgi:hypothetical protein